MELQGAEFRSAETATGGPGRTAAIGAYSGAAVHALLRVAAAEAPGRRFRSAHRSLFGRPPGGPLSSYLAPAAGGLNGGPAPDLAQAGAGSFGTQEASGMLCAPRLQPVSPGVWSLSASEQKQQCRMFRWASSSNYRNLSRGASEWPIELCLAYSYSKNLVPIEPFGHD